METVVPLVFFFFLMPSLGFTCHQTALSLTVFICFLDSNVVLLLSTFSLYKFLLIHAVGGRIMPHLIPLMSMSSSPEPGSILP